MSELRALLLIGSPRGAHSTSEALGAYLLERLASANIATAMQRIGGSGETRLPLHAAVEEVDLLLLSFPLYVDALPAGLLGALENLASERRKRAGSARQRLAVIVNSGFPEAEQARTAIAICEQFALEANFGWAGGLVLGCGSSINGRPLRQAGRAGRQAMAALDLAAAALAAGADVPAEAVQRMGALLMPKDLYVWFGTVDVKIKARAEGAHKRLYDKPYRCAANAGLGHQ